MKDEFGDRMKMYEKEWAFQEFHNALPVFVRIDGRGFSKFTKPFVKPYDPLLATAFAFTAETLMKDFTADFAYTQSDEITFVIPPKLMDNGEYCDRIFGGRKDKINSVFASMFTAFFNSYLEDVLDMAGKSSMLDDLGFAFFDCRSWQTPVEEMSNVVLWRAQDAERNSVSSFFRHTFGHSIMQGKNVKEMKEYAREHGKPWEDCKDAFKHGISIWKQDGKLRCENFRLGDFPWEDRELIVRGKHAEVVNKKLVNAIKEAYSI